VACQGSLIRIWFGFFVVCLIAMVVRFVTRIVINNDLVSEDYYLNLFIFSRATNVYAHIRTYIYTGDYQKRWA